MQSLVGPECLRRGPLTHIHAREAFECREVRWVHLEETLHLLHCLVFLAGAQCEFCNGIPHICVVRLQLGPLAGVNQCRFVVPFLHVQANQGVYVENPRFVIRIVGQQFLVSLDGLRSLFTQHVDLRNKVVGVLRVLALRRQLDPLLKPGYRLVVLLGFMGELAKVVRGFAVALVVVPGAGELRLCVLILLVLEIPGAEEQVLASLLSRIDQDFDRGLFLLLGFASCVGTVRHHGDATDTHETGADQTHPFHSRNPQVAGPQPAAQPLVIEAHLEALQETEPMREKRNGSEI